MNLFHHEKMKENVKDKINNIKMYTKDNVFDNFDISDLLNKDLLIPKTELKNFLYKKDLNNSNITSTSTNDISKSDNSQDEIISEINIILLYELRLINISFPLFLKYVQKRK